MPSRPSSTSPVSVMGTKLTNQNSTAKACANVGSIAHARSAVSIAVWNTPR
jgi:hypothetical protein